MNNTGAIELAAELINTYGCNAVVVRNGNPFLIHERMEVSHFVQCLVCSAAIPQVHIAQNIDKLLREGVSESLIKSMSNHMNTMPHKGASATIPTGKYAALFEKDLDLNTTSAKIVDRIKESVLDD
jgi:hypothetical protein